MHSIRMVCCKVLCVHAVKTIKVRHPDNDEAKMDRTVYYDGHRLIFHSFPKNGHTHTSFVISHDTHIKKDFFLKLAGEWLDINDVSNLDVRTLRQTALGRPAIVDWITGKEGWSEIVALHPDRMARYCQLDPSMYLNPRLFINTSEEEYHQVHLKQALNV